MKCQCDKHGTKELLCGCHVSELEDTPFIDELREVYETQDNRGTAWPICVEVQEMQQVAVVDPEYCANGTIVKQYVHPEADGHTADSYEEMVEFLMSNGIEEYRTDDIKEIHSLFMWVAVQFCLTSAGAEEYINANRHNLGRTRTYISHFSRRNKEMIKLMEDLRFKTRG